MSAVLQFNQKLTTIECANCCMTFAVPSRFETDRRADHRTFYCPQGHQNVFFDKSEAEKLRDQLANKEAEIARERNWHEHYKDQSEHRERQLRATRAVVTKTKARIAAGKCPCCTRQFSDLQEHMNEKHPEYGKKVGDRDE